MTTVASKLTYEEFLAADFEGIVEWVDGEVILLGSPSNEHQSLVLFLGMLLKHFVDHFKLGLVLIAPFQMKIGNSGREPDVLFIAKDRLPMMRKNYLDGYANLAIEIISADSRSRDRGDKYYEYEEAGVPEYWLLDPERKRIEFYRLGTDGAYALVAAGEDGIYRSKTVPGFWIKAEWLWQNPLPEVISILKLWGLVSLG